MRQLALRNQTDCIFKIACVYRGGRGSFLEMRRRKISESAHLWTSLEENCLGVSRMRIAGAGRLQLVKCGGKVLGDG